MPLFQDNPVRSTIALILTLGLGHTLVTRFLISSHAFHMTQTSVAILAIAALIFLVTVHHRREGRIMTQTQEEVVLITAFGLFWIAALLGWKAITGRGVIATGDRGDMLYPCSPDDFYCIVEEWSFIRD